MDLSLLWSSRKLQVTRDFVEDSRAEKISPISGVFHFIACQITQYREMPPSSYQKMSRLIELLRDRSLARMVKKLIAFRSGMFNDNC